jgi:hypothetical protein
MAPVALYRRIVGADQLRRHHAIRLVVRPVPIGAARAALSCLSIRSESEFFTRTASAAWRAR